MVSELGDAFEEGLLPHSRSLESGEAALEEERRLCYVAMTRARRRLALVHAATRTVGGMVGMPRQASRFLHEIPGDVIARQSRLHGGYSPPERGGGPHEALGTGDGDRARRPPPPRLEPGLLVRHEMFGLGRVVRLEGRGAGTKVRVRFHLAGERLLVVEYAGLVPVD